MNTRWQVEAHEAPFHLGQRVVAMAFTDCFGVDHPQSAVLTVASIRRIGPSYPDSRHAIAPYYRILAYGEGTLTSFDGAARFFQTAE